MTDFLLMVGGALFAMFVSGIVNYGKSRWVGLTDEEVENLCFAVGTEPIEVRLIEAKLKEKNNG